MSIYYLIAGRRFHELAPFFQASGIAPLRSGAYFACQRKFEEVYKAKMKAKAGMIITEMSGSLGGHTIQNSKGGLQIRNKPIPSGQPSAAQSLIRSYNPILQAGWRALSRAQQDVWNQYAVTHNITNKNGDPHPLSGHSLWMKYQFNQVYFLYPFLPVPDYFHTGPELITSLSNGTGYPYETFVSIGRNVSQAINTDTFAALTGPIFNNLQIGDSFIFQCNYHKFSGANTQWGIWTGEIGSSGTNSPVTIEGKQYYIITVHYAPFADIFISQTVGYSSFYCTELSLKKLL